MAALLPALVLLAALLLVLIYIVKATRQKTHGARNQQQPSRR